MIGPFGSNPSQVRVPRNSKKALLRGDDPHLNYTSSECNKKMGARSRVRDVVHPLPRQN